MNSKQFFIEDNIIILVSDSLLKRRKLLPTAICVNFPEILKLYLNDLQEHSVQFDEHTVLFFSN